MTEETIISDLSVFTPQTDLDIGVRQKTWRLIDYEAESFSGKMLYAGPGMEAPEISLPLHLDGLHRIYIGMHHPLFCDIHVRIRLTADPAYTLVRPETPTDKDRRGLPESFSGYFTEKKFAAYQLTEAFWKVADLTNQVLHISRFNEGVDGQGGNVAHDYSNLAFIRLVPLSEEEVEAYHRELPTRHTRRLFAMNDGGIFINVRTREDILAQLEPYRDSDVGVMLWATFKGENCTYRSRIARRLPEEFNPYDRFASGDRWDDALSALEAQGIDFMKEVVEAAHSMDIRIFPSLRLQTANKPAPRDMAPNSFQFRHPQFHSRDRNGRSTGHLSLAYPEVRKFWIDLLLEAVDYGFDGVHIIFCRSAPFVFYDPPVIDACLENYGEDPRDMDRDDPRFISMLSEYVNRFMREVRAAIDQVGERMNKRLEIACNVNTTPVSNLKWGIDMATWVDEDLVDYLMPHPANARNAHEWLPWYVDLVEESQVRLVPDLYPRRQPPAAALYSGETFYNIGCDGLAMWDTYARTSRISEWAMMKRLGHKDDLARWREEQKGGDYFRVIDLLSLSGRTADPELFQTDG